MTKALLITQCSDPRRWYANLVGQVVEYCGDEDNEYRSREPEGYTNFVLYSDAKIVEITNEI